MIDTKNLKMTKKVPILLITFNRFDVTKKVLGQIREYKPSSIYISSDGPRNKEELLIIQKIRNFILSYIDWECQIYTKFNETNLGCKKAVSESIDWVFDSEEYAIILEDDCLPSLDFFSFCEKLLPHYSEDERIYHIDGSNFIENMTRDNEYDYFFSRYALIWGWATWKRAWEGYDVDMKDYQEQRNKNFLDKIFQTQSEKDYWYNKFKEAKNIDTWDYQWFYSIWKNNGYTIQPTVNLVKNIGFDKNATHTKKVNFLFKLMQPAIKNYENITHPNSNDLTIHYDTQTSYKRFNIKKPYYKRFIEKFISAIYN